MERLLALSESCTNPDANLTIIVIRGSADIFYIFIWHNFHPHSLPDSALCSVKHTPAFQLLFASCMVGSVAEITDTDENRDGKSFGNKICNIHGKRQISALMISHKFTVYVHAADLIYSTEMQKKPLTAHIQTAFRKLDHTGIP